MGLLTKIAQRLAGPVGDVVAKSLPLMIDDRFHHAVEELVSTNIRDYATAARLGYKRNAAVFACISAYAFEYPSARLIVVGDDDAPRPNHRVQKLLDNPSDEMSGAELALYTITYKAIGGNAYLKKLRSEYGAVVGLQPFSDADVEPKPVTDAEALSGRWVRGFNFHQGRGRKEMWSVDDVIHLKWPSIDPSAPWKALGPIQVAAKEIGTDSEATRYQHALLRNDAIPRTLITVEDATLDKGTIELFKRQFVETYGGSRRGEPMVLRNAKVERLGLGLQELAFDALYQVTETRIAEVLRVPPAIAGLFAGLQKLTYANYDTARRVFAEQALIPLRRFDAEELTSSLQKDFPGNWRIVVDVDGIPALQENVERKWRRILSAVKEGLLTIDEGRAEIGYESRATATDPGADPPEDNA